jgi:geranylgeranyl diphosphate synthase type II
MLKEYLKLKKAKIETELEKSLNELQYPQVISEGMKYSVMNGGKRLRPILLLLVLELLGVEEKLGFSSAVAIELIHSYSLVHDDLPALDNDEFRRGKLTTHKKYGEAEAILIGDSLLTYAFTVLSEKNELLDSKTALNIVALTAKSAGIKGMIGGQTVDIQSEGKQVDIETLKYIHSHKTGKMIKLPVEIACLIAKTEKSITEKLIKYSELIGLAFQIKDDILDIEGDFLKLGKSLGSDVKIEKSTYPGLLGMEKTKRLLKNSIEEAQNIIKENFVGDSANILIELGNYIANRES